jgi:hypothetical protein
MIPKRKPVIRRDFIAAYVRAGMTYAQARIAYDTTVRVVEDAIVRRKKVCVGNVCSIVPVEKPPREVHKQFGKTREVYYLGRRIEFKVSIFKKFFDTHAIDWF